MEDLVEEVKCLIIEALDLEDITPKDIGTDAPLFNDGLGLDSIDALELGIALQKRFNIKIDSKSEDVQKLFYSVATLCRFVESSERS